MKKFQLDRSPVVFVVLIFCFASCNVYHTAPGTVNEAVESGDRVRVVTKENVSYEFKELRQESDYLVGITRINSDSAKKLNGHPQEREGKNIKVKFQKEEILAIYLKNRKMTRMVNIGVPVVSAAGLIGVTSKDFRPDVGN